MIRWGGELILVQEYAHGVPLSYLFRSARTPLPVPIVAALVVGILSGLHAAHETTDPMGQPLDVVHRDVSPQNVIVSVDGIPRLVDFGIAKARSNPSHTRAGFLKGKLGYMAPERLRSEPTTRCADVYAAGVLLWELLAHRRLHEGKSDAEFVQAVALGAAPTLTEALAEERPTISEARWRDVVRLQPIVARALSPAVEGRYPTAAEMAIAVRGAVRVAASTEVADWVRVAGADYLRDRDKVLASNEERYRVSGAHRRAETVIDLTGDGGSTRSYRRVPAPPPAGAADEPTRSTIVITIEDESARPRGFFQWLTAFVGLSLAMGALLGAAALSSTFAAGSDGAAPPLPPRTRAACTSPDREEVAIGLPLSERRQAPATGVHAVTPVLTPRPAGARGAL